MFCFQSRFTRTLRGGTSSPPSSSSTSVDVNVPSKLSSQKKPNHQSKSENKIIEIPRVIETTPKEMRRDSEAASEGSGTSSIQYIDQISKSESSSTDTLPGARADYFESEPLSPGLITLDIPQLNNNKTKTTNDNKTAKKSKKHIEKWRKKFSLKLKNDNERVLLIKNGKLENDAGGGGNDNGGLIRASSVNDMLALNGFSDEDEDDEEEEEDNSDDVDDGGGREKVNGNNDNNDDDNDDDDDMEMEIEEEFDEGFDVETETEEGSSIPSSPATVALSAGIEKVKVSYYDFLSVNCGSMRQETTSTSSPQLSSVDINNRIKKKLIEIDDSTSVSGDCCNPSNIVVGMNLINNKKTTDKLLDTPTTLPAARSCPNLEQQSIGCSSSASGSGSPSPSPGPGGPRFRPIEEGDVQVCYLNHTRTLVSKILSSKFLRRWETHRLYLNDACLSSKTMTGFLQQSVAYSSMTEVYTVARWDPAYKYCLRIVLPDGSLLLQASNAYTRDQWYHSILWKKNIYKYQNTVNGINTNEDVILRELKLMVDFALWTPLQDVRINSIPLEAVAKLLEYPVIKYSDIKDEKKLLEAEELSVRNDRRDWAESVLLVATPLLEKSPPPSALARALARLAQKHPSSPLVPSLGPAITRFLKHNVDFSKSPDMRKLIQMFIAALYENNDGEQSLRDYISSVHGPGSDCPHPRVLNNLVAICVAAIFHRFEVVSRGSLNTDNVSSTPPLQCYLHVLKITSEYSDWRPGLGEFLQPIPFPKAALADKDFQETMILPVMRGFANDTRCSVHKSLLPVREPRSGWIHIVAPSSAACPDDGTLFGEMLTTLLNCCCRRKKFISSLSKNTASACVLLGLRGCDAAQEVLCLMLEWKILASGERRRNQVISALQSTTSGQKRYAELCQRQRNLQELQQKGGPKKLALPVRATDADVALLLAGGALGNLECLSLAFTSVTSACAEQLIRLPGLRYLNLWGTHMGDAGLQMISEHLQKLQVLNLCETPVSDKGISTLASLTNLKKLNLNSTKLSAQTFQVLKAHLPSLKEYDVRYTEAW